MLFVTKSFCKYHGKQTTTKVGGALLNHDVPGAIYLMPA
jgi:hypothetical protein